MFHLMSISSKAELFELKFTSDKLQDPEAMHSISKMVVETDSCSRVKLLRLPSTEN